MCYIFKLATISHELQHPTSEVLERDTTLHNKYNLKPHKFSFFCRDPFIICIFTVYILTTEQAAHIRIKRKKASVISIQEVKKYNVCL